MDDKLINKWKPYGFYSNTNINNKHNLIYFHAFTGSYKNKLFLVNKLINTNFYAFDFPGHGNSLFNNINELTIEFYVKLAKEFIFDLNLQNLILYGHSMGGGICCILMNDNEIKKKVNKIILESPANPFTQKNYETYIKKLIPKDYVEMEIIGNQLFYNPISFFGSYLYYSRYLKVEFTRLSKMQYLKPMLDISAQNKFNHNIYLGCKNNDLLTLVILGKADLIVPYEESCAFFNHFKNCEIFSVAKAKHVPVSEKQNDCIKKINDFIHT